MLFQRWQFELWIVSFVAVSSSYPASLAFSPNNNGFTGSKGLPVSAVKPFHDRKSNLIVKSSVDSSEGIGNGDDDEISKLIGKRSQIKRKKREADEEPKLPDEPVVDLDLDKLPEFKTERPVRRAKPKDEEEEDEDNDKQDSNSKSSSSSAAAPIVDFQAEYDDENDFHIPNRFGISTVAWGDTTRGFVPSGKLTKKAIKAGKFVPGDLQLAYNELLEGGLVVIESSPMYGSTSRVQKLSAEQILQRCLVEQPEDLPESMLVESFGSGSILSVLQTILKGRGSLSNAMVNGLEDSLNRLGSSLIELYEAPGWIPSRFLCKALAAVVESGQCNRIGVVGVTSPGRLRKLQRILDEKYEVALTTNAFEFSLTKLKHEAMIDACKECGVIPLICNPLDGGLASGVYTATNPSGGQQTVGSATKFTFKELEKLQPLHSVQETVAERVRTRVIREMRDTQERFKSRYGPPPKINTDITTTQVALNYIVAKGGVPLPEVNTPAQAKEVLGCLGWTLTDEEVDMLDTAAALCKL